MMYQTEITRRIREQRVLHDVTLELTYGCNLDCFYCYNDREKPGKLLSIEQYEVLLNDLAHMQTMHLMLTGGEPMMHPQFFKIGHMARDLGFVTRVRTNGHSLSKTLAERMKQEVAPYMVEVSLHGATAQAHDRQTRVPGSFDRLLKNIASAKQAGLRCSVVSTPTAWNEHQIEDMFAVCDSLGVPLRFQGPVAPRDNGDTTPLQIQPAEKTWDLVTALVESRREPPPVSDDRRGQSVNTDKEEQAMCGVGVAGVDIDPFGNVLACMHLQTAAGNLHEQSIKDIWDTSPVFLHARKASVNAALQFADSSPKQYGAPLYCIAVEENANKLCGKSCGEGCS